MMHSYSPSSRQLAVPGIGFPQNIDVTDLAAYRDRPDDQFDARMQATDRAPWRPSLWAYLGQTVIRHSRWISAFS
jgi:hypothetical protein